MRKKNVPPPHAKYVTYFLTFSFLFLTMFALQSCNEPTAPTEEREITQLPKKANLKLDELDFLAKQIAATLNNKELQSYLQTVTTSSNKKEQILDAKEFLEKEINLTSNVKTSFRKKLINTIATGNLLNKTDVTTKTNKLNTIFDKLKTAKMEIGQFCNM